MSETPPLPIDHTGDEVPPDLAATRRNRIKIAIEVGLMLIVGYLTIMPLVLFARLYLL